MKEKALPLVSFEQSERLKELGFDWECYLAYRIADNEFGKKSKEPVSYQGKALEDYALAPTVALALMWFRNEKDERFDVRMFGFYDYEYMIFRRGVIMSSYRRYPDHEEAESAILDLLIERELEKMKEE